MPYNLLIDRTDEATHKRRHAIDTHTHLSPMRHPNKRTKTCLTTGSEMKMGTNTAVETHSPGRIRDPSHSLNSGRGVSSPLKTTTYTQGRGVLSRAPAPQDADDTTARKGQALTSSPFAPALTGSPLSARTRTGTSKPSDRSLGCSTTPGGRQSDGRPRNSLSAHGNNKGNLTQHSPNPVLTTQNNTTTTTTPTPTTKPRSDSGVAVNGGAAGQAGVDYRARASDNKRKGTAVAHPRCTTKAKATPADVNRQTRQVNTLIGAPRDAVSSTAQRRVHVSGCLWLSRVCSVGVTSAPELTPEQRAVVGRLKRPGQAVPGGEILIVNSCAGSGKTTTLVEVVVHALVIGHTGVRVCSFSKAAKIEFEGRLLARNAPHHISLTTHSIAMRALGLQQNGTATSIITDDGRLNKKIESICSSRISSFIANIVKKKAAAKNTVVTFIRKTLQQFFQSVDTEVQPYKEALDYHKTNKLGLPVNPGRFYEQAAEDVWTYCDCTKFGFRNQMKSGRISNNNNSNNNNSNNNKASAWNFHTHDSYMKCAQLQLLPIDCSLLLVDESQDLTACQIDWLAGQAQTHNIQIFFVGDAAQAVMGFRGGNPRALMSIKDQYRNVHQLHLTRSFRFGPQIAFAANRLLFIKQHSHQCVLFEPYRVVGGSQNKHPHDGISRTSLVAQRKFPCAVVTRTNLQMVEAYFDIVQGLSEGETLRWAVSEGTESTLKRAVRECLMFVDVFTEHKDSLPLGIFRGYVGLTWDRVRETVEDNENNCDYSMYVNFVTAHKYNAERRLREFVHMMDRCGRATGDWDVKLMTIHQAKGRECAYVEIFGNLMALAKYEVDVLEDKSGSVDPGDKSRRFNTANEARHGLGLDRCQARFACTVEQNDEIDLYYTAITRAQKEVFVPDSFWGVMEDMEELSEFVYGCKQAQDVTRKLVLPGDNRKVWTMVEAMALYRDIYLPMLQDMRDTCCAITE
ncbi:hypothetical protein SARC_12485 [Sphaeroforma arctica JP610]|uniref:UvrD-like helicase ATP-binding domain-containing protein n=1 Tax=Sphaeroforma arctica JP610 TaxID=667725 RepID=A0A0L0FDZ8_9EUKA|nr:hypothetical protein SARC_12485 [Sphaeroforma arctica JP610]KNC74980.1 hypothetical protein SARC_12485 [Sphaeroforma arctica JP610]|eukprot:XP_014148882.1 hypothetical protein SARC_12485 [Sphaeroforma arctica JP610]